MSNFNISKLSLCILIVVKAFKYCGLYSFFFLTIIENFINDKLRHGIIVDGKEKWGH